jgi:hypothetical protein
LHKYLSLSLGFSALAVGKAVAQHCNIIKNAFVACCLEAGATTTITPKVVPSFVRDIGILVIASVSIESFNQGASTSNVTRVRAGKLTEWHLYATRA